MTPELVLLSRVAHRDREITGPRLRGLLAALTALFAERPRDEELLLDLLRSEAATAGPAAALVRYDGYRRAVRDELGTDPGTALRAHVPHAARRRDPRRPPRVPHEPNPLLGRADDLAGVARLLRTSRVTSGLAHAVSREAEQRTVHFVALAGVTSDDDVADEVASTLGAGGGAAGAGQLRARDPRRGRAGARARVDDQGPAGAHHQPRAAGPVVGVGVPAARAGPVDHGRAVRPAGAGRAGGPADVVADLCRHLDGLPLAVELAAARMRVMSVPEIARRLDNRFALLRGSARDAPQRHHTMHAVVDWSWHQVEAERAEGLWTRMPLSGTVKVRGRSICVAR